MTNQAVPVRTVAEAMEEIAILEAAENASRNTVAANEDLSTAGGLIPKTEGGMVDISDPTRLLRIYVAESGEPRDVPAWTLTGKNSILRRKNPDGTRVFTDKANSGDWAPGEVPCMLNVAHPDRTAFRKMGLINDCPAAHLASLYDQQQHMKNRHRREWATIEAARTQLREDEERAFRQLQSEVATATLAAATAPSGRTKAGA